MTWLERFAVDSYDAIPYQSTPFPETHPAHLAPLARLFGLESPDPARCRVLELGCASGGNLIPMAWQLPQSEFVGIELSAEQARSGAELIARLGLDNVSIRQGDLAELDESLGHFDYIIAHGVYSWVPAPVRQALLRLCERLLSERGIAYISYNTLPGWNWRGNLREMLRYHTRNAQTPGERLAEAQAFLEVLEAGKMGGPEGQYMAAEVARLRERHPSYLYHEYLEEENRPFLFSEFVTDLRTAGLEYLGDIELGGMFPTELSETQAEWLARYDDPIEYWQYLDLLGQRNYRQSLVCRRGHIPGLDLDLAAMSGFALFSTLSPPKKLDLRRRRSAPFSTPTGQRVEIQHPLTQAAMAEMGRRYPDAIAYPELLARAQAEVRAAGNPAAAEEESLLHELFSLYAYHQVGARLTPAGFPQTAGERPRLHPWHRQQAAAGIEHLTGVHHTTLSLDPFSSRLVGLLDGEQDREALINQLCHLMVEEEALHALTSEEQRRNPARLQQLVSRNVDYLIGLFTRHGLFEG